MRHLLKNNNIVIDVVACFLVFCSVFFILRTAVAFPIDNSDKIIDHLEFLGYKVNKDKDFLTVKHANKLDFFLKKYKNGILFQSFFRGNNLSKTNKADYLEFANSLNEYAGVSRFYIDKNGNLIIEAWMPGIYEKTSFSNFLDAWNEDLTKIFIKHILEAKRYLE